MKLTTASSGVSIWLAKSIPWYRKAGALERATGNLTLAGD